MMVLFPEVDAVQLSCQPEQAFQVDAVQWSRQPHQVSRPKSSQAQPIFFPGAVQTSPSIPKNDDESLNCPQAEFWETARQEEINACYRKQ